MALPIREQILQALATRVSAARGLEVYDEHDLPFTVLIEGEESAEDNNYDMTNVSLPFTVGRGMSIKGKKQDEWYEEGNQALADLIKEIYAGGESVGDLAHGIDYAGGFVDVVTDGARGVTVQAYFNVRYSFVHGDPYSQTLE